MASSSTGYSALSGLLTKKAVLGEVTVRKEDFEESKGVRVDIRGIMNMNETWLKSNAESVYPLLAIKGAGIKRMLMDKSLSTGWNPEIQRGPDIDFMGLKMTMSQGDFLEPGDINFPRLCAMTALYCITKVKGDVVEEFKGTALASKFPPIMDPEYLYWTKFAVPGFGYLFEPLFVSSPMIKESDKKHNKLKGAFIAVAISMDWAAYVAKSGNFGCTFSRFWREHAKNNAGVMAAMTRNSSVEGAIEVDGEGHTFLESLSKITMTIRMNKGEIGERVAAKFDYSKMLKLK